MTSSDDDRFARRWVRVGHGLSDGVNEIDHLAEVGRRGTFELEGVAGGFVCGGLGDRPIEVIEEVGGSVVVHDPLVAGEEEVDRDRRGLFEAGDHSVHAAGGKVEGRGTLAEGAVIGTEELDPRGAGGEEVGIVERDVEMPAGFVEHGKADAGHLAARYADFGEQAGRNQGETLDPGRVVNVCSDDEFAPPTNPDEVVVRPPGTAKELVTGGVGIGDELLGGFGVAAVDLVSAAAAAVHLQNVIAGVGECRGGGFVPAAMGLDAVVV